MSQAKEPGPLPAGAALEDAGFEVTRTGLKRGHYTVTLPKPLTQDVVNSFNIILGRMR